MNTVIPQPASPARRLMVPKAPVLILEGRKFYCLTLDGELTTMSDAQAKSLIHQHMPIVCHGPHIARHLHIDKFPAYDVLELFAFVNPGQFTVPTPRGIARALHLLEPQTPEDQCLSLRDSIRHLLADLTAPGRQEKTDPAAIAAMMGLMVNANDAGELPAHIQHDGGWPFAPVVLAALGRTDNPPTRGEIKSALRLWDKLPEWAVHAPEPSPGHYGVTDEEVGDRLHKLLTRQKKEDRPQQKEYSLGLAEAFAPKDETNSAHVVVAEAGTGVGKTLGYLAPATVWAEKNGGPVWVSTYTRNLQRQVDAELDKLYDDPVAKARKVVTRKGRENYLCLLNLEDAAQTPAAFTNEADATVLGLMSRWVGVTDDGDLAGKDFPGWLAGLLGWNKVYNFADRRGECIYSACPHFNKCFIEKSVRKAKRADIVIANHALVMHQTAVVGPEDVLPSRYIFDEGHHIFDAADSAFCAHLNGTETADLRRWLVGSETAQKTRARGIKRRLDDLIAGDPDALKDVEELIEAARTLPAPGWRQRLADDKPKGAVENFLILCRQQVYARNKEQAGFYSLETDARPPVPGLFESAHALAAKLNDLKKPMLSLISRLKNKLEAEADTLDSSMRERIHFMISSLHRRVQGELGSWIDMLQALEINKTPGCVDWIEVTRSPGHLQNATTAQEADIGFYRYATDPAEIFATHLRPHLQGAVITSATLRDASDADAEGWVSPKTRTGSTHLAGNLPVKTFSVTSPFLYPEQTRVLVINDVKKDDTREIASAYRALFTASGGGALGIFTAVQRLRAVHKIIAEPLELSGLPIYAQHVDQLDIGTLIDIFREEENACLLGTDATRDGIDVPGRSLRLVVYDRVPWPRPTILHKARREHFGKGYDDMLTRFKLKQAYGRLIRAASDKGVFVMLDGGLPSRLAAAFPPGVEVERVGLAAAVDIVKNFSKE